MNGPWSRCLEARPEAKARLVCFPFAGGSAATYRGWAELLPRSIEAHVVDLPGRLPRISETPLPSVDALADASARHLEKTVNGKPYAFFGHSMGAVVAFETALRLARRGPAPSHLFVSARQAPSLAWRRPLLHALPDAEFHAALLSLGGTPRQLLASPELWDIVMPALRSDFTAIETYRWRAGERLDCGISAFGGRDDPDVGESELLAWADLTTGLALVEQLAGGHFYLDAEGPAVTQRITADLAHALAWSSP